MGADAERIVAVAETVGEFYGQAMVAMSLCVTAVSGYLLGSYLVGLCLTRFQAIFFTGPFFVLQRLYDVWSLWILQKRELLWCHIWPRIGAPIDGRGGAHINVLGILASLKFMWDVRHPKAE